MREPHGQPNNLNIYTLDVESDVTGHGAHRRLIVMSPDHGRTVEVREDDLHGLPASTDAQRRKVMNGWQRLHGRGRLRYVGTSEPFSTAAHSWTSVVHTYSLMVASPSKLNFGIRATV